MCNTVHTIEIQFFANIHDQCQKLSLSMFPHLQKIHFGFFVGEADDDAWGSTVGCCGW